MAKREVARETSRATPPQPPSNGVPKKKRRSFKALWWAAFLLLIGGYVGFTWVKASAPQEVEVASATFKPIEASFTAEAYVRGKEYQLSSEAGGRVTVLPVREGDAVRSGTILLSVDASDADASMREAQSAVRAALASESRARAEYNAASSQLHSRIAAAEVGVAQALANLRRVKSGARQQEIAQADQRVERARVGRDDARKSYERAKFLFEQGAIARASYDTADSRLKAAETELLEAEAAASLVRAGASREEIDIAEQGVRAARAELVLAKSGEDQLLAYREAIAAATAAREQAGDAVARLSISRRKTDLRAPVDGIITRLSTERGSVLSPGVPVITLSTRQDLRIEAEISSEDAGKARPGLQVRITSPAYPGRIFPAHIVSILPVGELKPDAAIRTRIIRARVALQGEWELFRPGMEVDLEGKAVLKRALCIPSDAVNLTGEKATVFAVRNDIIEEIAVKTGYSNPDLTEVLEGLREGDRVVTTGKEGLAGGKKVKVKG